MSWHGSRPARCCAERACKHVAVSGTGTRRAQSAWVRSRGADVARRVGSAYCCWSCVCWRTCCPALAAAALGSACGDARCAYATLWVLWVAEWGGVPVGVVRCCGIAWYRRGTAEYRCVWGILGAHTVGCYVALSKSGGTIGQYMFTHALTRAHTRTRTH